MNRFVIAILSLLFVAACSAEPVEKGEQPEVYISFFSGGRLIPGDGSAPIEEATFIVEHGKFTHIGKKGEFQAPRGSVRVDLAGQTVMPLLINLHGHPGLNTGASFGPKNYKRESVTADLNRYLYYGVDAVVAAGSDAGNLAFEVRDEQNQGKTTGAKLYTAGRGITARGGWPASLADVPIQVANEAEARKAVADNADKKVDFIKIWVDDNMGRVPKLSPALYRAIIDEAHKRNLRVLAHVFYLADAKDLVDANVDGLIHSIRDRDVDDALIAAMKQKNVFLAPTLTAHESKFVYADAPRWLGEQTMREVYPAQLSAYLADSVTVNRFKRAADTPAFRQQYATAVKNLKTMADAGVRIAFGTDSGAADTYPGYFEHRELELMVKAGLSPLEVIKAATSTSADVLGVKDLGTLAVGKTADFFALTQNPLSDMVNSKEIDKIYKNGQELPRLPLIQNITIEAPRITQADRNADAAAQVEEARAAAEARLPHFGKWPLGKSQMVRAMPIPMPMRSSSSVTVGPPDRITVKMRDASAADLTTFFSKALVNYNWKPASGGCFERIHSISKKTETLCVQASPNSAVLTITER